MAIKTSTLGKIIIFGILGLMAVKLCADLTVYISDNVAQIRAEKKYAEYKKQKEEEHRLSDKIQEEIQRTQQQRRRRYYYY